MNALSLIPATLTMSSREIADLTGKRHPDVLRDIRLMLDELKEDVSRFARIYLDSMNRQQTEYLLDRELTDTLLTGYSAVARRTVIARWHKLEADAGNPASAAPAELTRMDILRIAMESEEARIKAEAERDEAIRTKAQIGSKREATAMAKASAATREADKLRDQLGFNTRHATVIAVEKAIRSKFGPQDWRQLKAWCKAHGVASTKVHDPRWGEAVAWPASAWLEVFDIDLVELFGGAAA